MMNATTETLRVGTRVSYEDMANPLRVGTVSRVLPQMWGTQFEITWDKDDDGNGEIHFSDCRQHGWKVVS